MKISIYIVNKDAYAPAGLHVLASSMEDAIRAYGRWCGMEMDKDKSIASMAAIRSIHLVSDSPIITIDAMDELFREQPKPERQ